MLVLHEKMSGYSAGVYDCYTNAEYHAAEGVSKSDLDLIHRSPAHFKGAEREETAAMKFGSAFHSAVLEPEHFVSQYYIVSGDRRTKAVKAEIQEAEAAGKTALTKEEFDAISEMQNSVFQSRIFPNIREGAVIEHSVFSEIDGVRVKCRPDGWQMDKGILFDLKSCDDASPDGFARTCAKYRYHVQDAFYRNVVGSLTGEDADKLSFIFVAVEKKPPYAVALYSLDELAKLQGWVEAREDLRTYREAAETDTWRAYSPKIETLSLPRWAVAVE